MDNTEEIKALYGTIESMKQTNAALLKKLATLDDIIRQKNEALINLRYDRFSSEGAVNELITEALETTPENYNERKLNEHQ